LLILTLKKSTRMALLAQVDTTKINRLFGTQIHIAICPFQILSASNSMNVASVTVIAMNHGFIAALEPAKLHTLAGVNVSLISTCPARYCFDA
jgi:hypothetical protein